MIQLLKVCLLVAAVFFSQALFAAKKTLPQKRQSRTAKNVKRSWRLDLEVGYQYAKITDPKTPLTIDPFYNRGYIEPSGSLKFESLDTGSSLSLNFDVRGLLGSQSELDLRGAHLDWLVGPSNLIVGYQEIGWGETFGINIADIVNPRDLRDPLLLDPSWQRLAVLSINEQLTFSGTNIQLICTPLPRNNRVNLSAYGLAGSDLPDFRLDDAPESAEYGARIGHLFDIGLDFHVFAFNHWNRNLVYLSQIQAGNLFLIPQRSRVSSYGASFSESIGSFVLRGDSVLNSQLPLSDLELQSIAYHQQYQSVLGIDYALESGGSIGFQYQEQDTTGLSTLEWWSAKVSRDLIKDRLGFDVFGFRGINNDDLWIEPQLRWTPGQIWKLLLRWDYVWASGSPFDPDAGVLAIAKNQSRVMAWASCKF